MAICAYVACGQEFQPVRRTQRFHTTDCKAAYWYERRHAGPHKCPHCGVMHDPEELAVLDALEMMVADESFPKNGYQLAEDVVDVEDLRAFIARRRAIMAST
jgi:hypothetical protein